MRKEKRTRSTNAILIFIIIVQSLLILLLLRPRQAPKPVTPLAKPQAAVKGRIAIVLDDWGYNLNNLGALEGIQYPLTASVLPNLTYSQRVAEELHGKGYEVILHLPMEPQERYRLEKKTILTAMGEATINSIISQDLKMVPYIKGVSNHMGSRATEDTNTMAIVFRRLKSNGLYFLDSFVSGKTVAKELAQKMDVRFARRDVFLDNTEEPEYIKRQLQKLKLRAKAKGEAIGIGHDRKVTIAVLKEAMPGLAREGYKFVYLSELAR